MRHIIFHAYQWKLNDITEHLKEIKEAGFTAIQISPMQGCKNDGKEDWLLYQPLDLNIVESEQVGSRKDLIKLCDAAHRIDVKILADIILRHVAGASTGELIPHQKVNKHLLKYYIDTQNIENYNDRKQLIHRSCGVPMLNYNNPYYIQLCKDFLINLKMCGVDAFRLDQLKHFALPSEGCEFLNIFKDICGNDGLTYGEVLDCDRQLLDQYADIMKVLTLCDCNSYKERVLYTETHDTFYTFGYTRNITQNELINRWCGLLWNNPDNNVIWFARPFDETWKNERVIEANKR